MRFVLFLAALGVVWQGNQLAADNPAASVFRLAAGNIGYIFFGIVIWAAAITSVIGASYTSVSFVKTFHPFIAKNEKIFISAFIIIATIVFIIMGDPVKRLIFAGAINGIILPAALVIILAAARRSSLMNSYKHPAWLQVFGWLVVAVLSWMSYKTFYGLFIK
jgi:Mn2+/Fe2+ NRAMP family transporter